MSSTISSLNDNISALNRRFAEVESAPIKRKNANATGTTKKKQSTLIRTKSGRVLPVLNINGNAGYQFSEIGLDGQKCITNIPSGTENDNGMDISDMSNTLAILNGTPHSSNDGDLNSDDLEKNAPHSSININGWNPVKSRAQIRDDKKNSTATTTNARASRVTPIQLQELDATQIGHISGLLSNEIGPNKFHIQKLSGNRATRIYCTTHEAKAKVLCYEMPIFNSIRSTMLKQRRRHSLTQLVEHSPP